MYRWVWSSQIMVIGCGNVLFGDDGFGPAVIEHLQTKYRLPDEIVLIDAGTSSGELLFDALLSEDTPAMLIIIDAMDFGLEPGIVESIPLEAIPTKKLADFSVHQFPALDILKELKERRGVDLRILACQVESIPMEIRQGLSSSVARAVGQTAKDIFEILCREVQTEVSRI